MANKKMTTKEIITEKETEILESWLAEQTAFSSRIKEVIGEKELKKNSAEFLELFRVAISGTNYDDIDSVHFSNLKEFLSDFSIKMVQRGIAPSTAASYIFSIKDVLFEQLNASQEGTSEAIIAEIINVNKLIDQLGIIIFESYSKGREEVIKRQSLDMNEINTPVIQVWNKILLVPLIGTLDSHRTQIVMEKLLDSLIKTKSTVAIIDITGVPTVDTMVAQHLIKTVSAIRLLGAESVITGISAPIAQTIVHLGIDLSNITTRAVMADGLQFALASLGKKI